MNKRVNNYFGGVRTLLVLLMMCGVFHPRGLQNLAPELIVLLVVLFGSRILFWYFIGSPVKMTINLAKPLETPMSDLAAFTLGMVSGFAYEVVVCMLPLLLLSDKIGDFKSLLIFGTALIIGFFQTGFSLTLTLDNLRLPRALQVLLERMPGIIRGFILGTIVVQTGSLLIGFAVEPLIIIGMYGGGFLLVLAGATLYYGYPDYIRWSLKKISTIVGAEPE